MLFAQQAFNGCTALTSISLPTSLTEIGIVRAPRPAQLLFYCSEPRHRSFTLLIHQTPLRVPRRHRSDRGLHRLRQRCFKACTALTTIVIPSSVTAIDLVSSPADPPADPPAVPPADPPSDPPAILPTDPTPLP